MTDGDKLLTHLPSAVLQTGTSWRKKQDEDMSNASLILNPDTPLAFLIPSEATQLEIYRYCSVATLGVSLESIADRVRC